MAAAEISRRQSGAHILPGRGDEGTEAAAAGVALQGERLPQRPAQLRHPGQDLGHRDGLSAGLRLRLELRDEGCKTTLIVGVAHIV